MNLQFIDVVSLVIRIAAIFAVVDYLQKMKDRIKTLEKEVERLEVEREETIQIIEEEK